MRVLKHIKNGATSVVLRLGLYSDQDGNGLTGLADDTTGLIISTIADNEASATTYTVAGSTIEDVTTSGTLGTYAAPTASKCRFEEVDSTNHPGLYELQLASARFNVSSASQLFISITGATNLLDASYVVHLNNIPANILSVYDLAIDGAGTEGDPWGPA